jgi:hypothetical protein
MKTVVCERFQFEEVKLCIFVVIGQEAGSLFWKLLHSYHKIVDIMAVLKPLLQFLIKVASIADLAL